MAHKHGLRTLWNNYLYHKLQHTFIKIIEYIFIYYYILRNSLQFGQLYSYIYELQHNLTYNIIFFMDQYISQLNVDLLVITF